jgi:hypothetical protein
MGQESHAPLMIDQKHPLYTLYDYRKFRICSIGGRAFIESYLEMFSSREDKDDFQKRLCISHNPGFAAEGVEEVKNAIYQRMPEIIRSGGTESYTKAIAGNEGGVDLEGNSMNTFMGQKVLPELLSMGRVGVYVDMPEFNPDSTLADLAGANYPHPYMYHYRLEDILNWNYCFFDNELIYTVVLLRDRNWQLNDAGLPVEEVERFRLVRLLPGGQGVSVRIYEKFLDPNNGNRPSERVIREILLPKLTRIPFVVLDIGKSLLNDIADYQVGLLNLASSDLMYSIHSNFPFYVEGYDPKTDGIFNKKGPRTIIDQSTGEEKQVEGDAGFAPEIGVGTMHGRLFPIGSPPPAFIHPSPEPLKASMEKQDRMKEDIRRLLNIAIANVQPSRASAESKKVDQQGLESGLAGIGLELEGAERDIAKLWAMYEEIKITNLNISYPSTYSLKTDAERIAEATAITAVQGAAPSRTFQKEIAKLAARKLLEGKVDATTLDKIFKEIDKANYATSDITNLVSSLEAGICDAATASEAAGFNPEVVQKAQQERVQRLAEIAIAQSKGGGAGAAASQARGNPDGVPDGKDEKTISQNPDAQPPGGSAKRGKGK